MPKEIVPLVSYFKSFIPLSKEEIEALDERITERRIKRKQFILQENEICQYYTFVVSGCLKMYSIDNNGEEHNLQFASENDWIVDIDSFHNKKPSKLYIIALENSIVLQIEKNDLWYLYTYYPKFDRNFRVIIENKFIELQNRVLQNISATGEEKYDFFLKQYPQLANRLPNTQISSYLGITPQFLSKIRQKRVKK
ncbi:cyclic nucleotide-binding protein [Chryseobacterium lactis]|uniref:Crp/Fnr family transcriptional regulator n=1 Tax=Chryseobacterium lactis TaxID=1241981 RepID=A0A3G6RGJ4_CHRLC|nr:Crp/Fnr family transcriptional regulator [Chryseobacterium lactis]AZA83787.1 Crp/Fnr family transcriptional regulator [Chryseobacterium lactis]AZB04172.1 Crp/Fnr family transcriptional regulator [Chryseobacterium lactis]PNW12919.1 cyclic nucleotide-binding protein [Chryseobacterium lactis]